MSPENLEKIKGIYSRLRGIKMELSTGHYIRFAIGKTYNDLLEKLFTLIEESLKEEIESLLLKEEYIYYDRYSGKEYIGEIFRSNLTQLIYWLEDRFGLSDKIAVVGGLISQIKDKEIQSRCLDLLSAPDHFDRAVNQATLIFENRLKQKTGKTTTGTKLVNETIKSNANDSIVVVSTDNDIQQGFADICRGIMLYLRNPSHHLINSQMPKEDAIKICAFIDLILQDLEKCKINDKSK